LDKGAVMSNQNKVCRRGNGAPQDWQASRANRRGFGKLLSLLWLLVAGLFFGTAAHAANPDSVSFTLEGCRNDGTIKLPDASGKFVCPDGVYTSGNLGKGWNELDLVPYRLTAKAGNSAPQTQIYSVAVVVDNEDAGKPGYDVLSAVVPRSGACTVSYGDDLIASPGLGGIAKSRYRLLAISQPKGDTCVMDFYARLALGAHLFPGASLHANLALPTATGLATSGIGARDVSIPVKEISPQGLSKDMSAAQDGTRTWNLTKTPSASSVSFGDVCAADAPTSKPVDIKVEWTVVGTTAGKTTAVANIHAKNPASRIITVNLTDSIYKGTTQDILLDKTALPSMSVPAQTEKTYTHTVVLDASKAGAVGDYLNDVVTATYIDTDTGIVILGQATAVAKTTIAAGTVSNATADIRDNEFISGPGLSFSVVQPTIGSFSGYTAGDKATAVAWTANGLTASGSVVFKKTLYLDGKTVTTGTLKDSAALSTEGLAIRVGPVVVDITSTANVALTLEKLIPDGYVRSNDKLEITFDISRTADPSYKVEKILTFPAGVTKQSVSLTGLVPDDYTVKETKATYIPAMGPSFTPVGLVPENGTTKTASMKVVNGKVEKCSDTVTFNNLKTTDYYASAQVKKLTEPALQPGDPNYVWTFQLFKAGALVGFASANAGGTDVIFTDDSGKQVLLESGSYSVKEALVPGWNSKPMDGCDFNVTLPYDSGKLFGCVYKNTKYGKAKVVKTVNGAAPTGSQVYPFQLREGASTTTEGIVRERASASAANGGLISFTYDLVPGSSYQLCEVLAPGWSSSLGTLVPASYLPPDGVIANPNVDNSVVCVDFKVQPGETRSFAVNNTPPPGGNALTIGYWKNWASCAASSTRKKPVLDETLYNMLPNGVTVGRVQSSVDGSFALKGKAINATPDCPKAVSLLNKRDFSGSKRASDPLYNMAAQLVAAQLNYGAGAKSCNAVTTAIDLANKLLTAYQFDGAGSYTSKLSPADAVKANNHAQRLDDYNNNRPEACFN